MKILIEKYKVLAFVVFAYAFSWLCWLPVVHVVQSDLFKSPGWAIALIFLGGYGPTLSALLIQSIIGGWVGVKTLLKKLLMWRIGFKWFGLILFVWPIINALALGIYWSVGGELGSVNYGLLPWIPAVYLVSLFLGPLAEELGWRGFALPILYKKYGFFQSSILLGVIWAMWHAPLFWAATGTAISGFPVTVAMILIFILGTTGTNIIYTWLYKNTQGGAFVGVLAHLSTNATGTISLMLFQDISVGNRQVIYYYFIAVTWSLILSGALYVRLFKSKISTNGKLNLVEMTTRC
ncbi:MAG: type II CAAX endopeptidase family protein [Pseudomonadota bacterium]